MDTQKILNLIKADRSFRTKLIEKDDSYIKPIYKFVDFPDCQTCLEEITDIINKNIDFINTIIDPNNKPTQPVLETKLTNQQPKPIVAAPIRVAGEVYEIDADPEQYKELIELSQTNRWIFRGFNILEKINKDGKKVWTIFFY